MQMRLILATILSAIACVGGSHSLAAEPPVTSIAIAPNGRTVAVGSQAGVIAYRWCDLKPLNRQVETRVSNVHDLAFSPDGTRLAIAGGEPAQEGMVEIVEWPSGRLISLCSGHGDSVQAVQWLDDETLVSASLDHQAVVWNAATGQQMKRLEGHSRGVAAVGYLSGAELIVSGGLDSNIRVWGRQLGGIVRTLNNHTGAVHALAVRPAVEGLPMIASAGSDRTVRFWQPTIGRLVRIAQLDTTPLALAWLPDGSLVAAATTDGTVLLIDPATVKIVERHAAVEGWAYAVAVHRNGGALLVGGRNGQLKRVDLRKEAEPDGAD